MRIEPLEIFLNIHLASSVLSSIESILLTEIGANNVPEHSISIKHICTFHKHLVLFFSLWEVHFIGNATHFSFSFSFHSHFVYSGRDLMNFAIIKLDAICIISKPLLKSTDYYEREVQINWNSAYDVYKREEMWMQHAAICRST